MGYIYTNIARIWETVFSGISSHLTLGLGGIFFLGIPTAAWAAAYGYAIAAKSGGLPVPGAVLVGLSCAFLIGIVFAFFYARMSNDSFAVITLASVLAMDALLRSWDSLTGGVLGISGVPRPAGVQSLADMVVMQGVLALFALGVEYLLAGSVFGRSLRALKENKTSLTALGTSASGIGQWAVLLGSCFAGAAGILTIMRIQFLDPSFGGFFLLLQALTIAIVANTPSVVRMFTVTIAIVLIPEVLRFFALPTAILGYSRTMLYGLILIFLIYYVAYNTSVKRDV